MSNIKLILTENKASPYRKQRVVGRHGDGELTVIDVELLQADGKTPYSIFSNHELLFVGTNSKGQYTDGVPEIIDGQNGKIRYTFTKENFSVIREFKRAYFQLTDADGNRVTFQDFYVDVLKNSDINQEHATVYVRLLELLLEDFEKQFGDKTIDFEERFKTFFQAKEIEYEYIYQMYNDLLLKLEKMTGETLSLQEKQMEIINLVEEYDILTKAESSANVVYQILGDEAEITITLDYSNKIAKSDIENPNKMFYNVSNALMPFTISGSEGTQAYYDRLAVLDNQLLTVSTITNEAIAQVRLRWELVKFIDKNIPLLFETDDNNQKIDYLRQKITSVKSTIYGRGTGSGGNKLDHRFYVSGLLEAQGSGNTTSQISKITDQLTDVEKIRNMISSAGQIDSLIYSTKSDGNLYSILYSDYATLEVKMKISAKQVIEALMKTHHLENLATQEEAETGANNSKTMTPLRVFQAIAKWTKDKFVSLTENETVLGIKNFANGLQVGGRNVLSQNGLQTYDHTSATDSAIQSGMIRFIRFGDFILVNFNFQCKSVNIASGGNIIRVLESDILPTNSIQIDITDDKAVTVETSGKLTALWGLNANSYYAGSAMYFAKNKL
ncbi:BppU family phage baseplate upper protein [Enterococcus gilvus]|uniref:BppU N-terminal domain-containing protein n=2 Tax=Enterococcus gilvus TaxID=160453 RepID=R2VLT0_9ENTE|nr:BppU family phage baseplate upper protein [Enterococcus gilvus]EOI58830.1 hypothetical protein UKC_00015 [Enterococcus gilvus ATCC BAA-350]EOW79293.1 hypothetical protein I592_03432 [Enterococcus gilvus ATCC BAA-350]